MFGSVVFSILTGASAGVLFELFANEIPNAALLNAAALHLWVVFSGILSAGSCYQFIFHPKIPFQWILGIVMLAYVFLYFKSQAMENLPMPVFIVCSNMKLVATLLIDYFVFSKPFPSPGQVVGVLCVTIGCILITLQSQQFAAGKEYAIEYDTSVGLLYVFISVIAVSVLMPLSNLAVTKHPGSSFDELSFMQNALSVPLFYPQLSKLVRGVGVLQLSPKVVTLPVPARVASVACLLRGHVLAIMSSLGGELSSSSVWGQSGGGGGGGDGDVSHCERLSSVRLPLALLCMLGTILLTPVHRKQISRVSIAANSSALGQLIVCAVKTAVLVALFVILHENSSAASSADSGFSAGGDSGGGGDGDSDCSSSSSSAGSVLAMGRQAVAQCSQLLGYCHRSLSASMTAEAVAGVALQTLGSVGFILASPSPPEVPPPHGTLEESGQKAAGAGARAGAGAGAGHPPSGPGPGPCSGSEQDSDRGEEGSSGEEEEGRAGGVFSSTRTLRDLLLAAQDQSPPCFHSSRHLGGEQEGI
jgi:hypothetical protein